MNDELHERAKASAAQYLRSERELFEVLLEVDQQKGYEDFEYTYLTPYYVKELKISECVAKTFVRVIRKSQHVPQLSKAVRDGGLSIYKAKVLCPAITPENATEWIAKAQKLSKQQLEKEVAKANGVDTRSTKLNLSIEGRHKLERIRDLESTRQGRFVSLEEASESAYDEYLYRRDPLEKAERARKADGPTAARHQVNVRDLTRCQAIYKDGTQCTETKWLHQHHIVHQKDGGLDTVENLVTLCSGHHRLLHKHDKTILGRSEAEKWPSRR